MAEHTQFVEVFPDHPIREATGVAFDFQGLAETLAGIAWNPANATPLCVVIRGDWGRGKTTLMYQTQRLLLSEKTPSSARTVKPVWFNAWKYPTDNTVLAGLLGAVLDRMRTGEPLEQLKLMVREKRGRVGRALLKIAAPWLPDDVLQDPGPFAPAEEKRAFYDSFKQLFAEVSFLWQTGTAMVQDTEHRDVNEILRELQRDRILAVFLDDLDRCRPERVREVLEAINLFLDLPGVCFYLGLDWARLSERLGEGMEGREEQFLEKIVQVSFTLPPINEPGTAAYVRELLHGTALAELFQEPNDEVDHLAAVAGSLRHKHPRHVKRFLNDLSVGLSVLRNTEHPGDPDSHVPGQAILTWHLLHEILPVETWEEISSLEANLQRFLATWGNLERQKSDAEEISRSDPDAVARVHQTGVLARHVPALAKLSRGQRLRLVNLGSPPRDESVVARHTSGVGDLQDLHGNAWVAVEGGTFTMGASDIDHATPEHLATVSPFSMSRYPVTNRQYARFLDGTPDMRIPEHWPEGRIPDGKERHPVVGVSWNDGVAFCRWLVESASPDGAVNVRLPTEAEWEFAARGEAGRTYPWGDEQPDAERANYGNSVGDTTPVDSYPTGTTPGGIADLAGNVWEWCNDWYGGYGDHPASDPQGPEQGTSRVLRGGAFNFVPQHLRAAYRVVFHPGYRDVYIGFRVVWVSAGEPD